MSETYLGQPRFVVTSVTGSTGERGNNSTASFQVLDRPYCYALAFEADNRWQAELIAGLLNAGNQETASKYVERWARQKRYQREYGRRFK